MWNCQTSGCNAVQPDTVAVCPYCNGESPALKAAKEKAVADAIAKKAAEAQIALEAEAQKKANEAVAQAVADAVK